MSQPLPPHIIAGADQELAEQDQRLDELIAKWRNAQATYDTFGFDRLTRIAVFAVEHSRHAPYPVALLAVAIERLAR